MRDLKGEFKKSDELNISTIANRKIICGEDDGLMQVSPLKHQWARDIFKKMQKNNWVAEEVNFQKDKLQWESDTYLTEQERECFIRCLAFASNLDGLLVNSLSEIIKPHITSPEVSLTLARQIYEEALHVDSYSCMIEALNLDPEKVYGLYKRDKGLYYKNAKLFNIMYDVEDLEKGSYDYKLNYLNSCVQNLIYEGVFFFSVFLMFYNFGRHNKLQGCTEMIQFINRDEDLHVSLFVHMIKAILTENPELNTKENLHVIKHSIELGVEMEYEWACSCIGDGVLDLNKKGMKDFLTYIGQLRMKQLGLEVDMIENPYEWFNDFSQGNNIKGNFFETTVKEYQDVQVGEWKDDDSFWS